MATVKLTNVKKQYQTKDFPAVVDFNLEIADKEFVVFVGPSGCGKSTTLRMIAGLEDITEGTIEIDGEVVNDLQPKDRNIAMVFQNYALYPHLTVFENMAFPLRLDKKQHYHPLNEKDKEKVEKELKQLKEDPETNKEKIKNLQELLEKGKLGKGYSQEEIYQRVTNAAEILGITEFLTRKPRALSGGQRQRVAIGRAMVRDSKVFLMDEPLSNLDAKLRNQMRSEIILLRKKIDSTFVYVTHDQTEAMTLGDRIVIMKKGYIMQTGTPDDVFDRPANLFVAEFIGAPKMNTFKVKLERVGDRYFVYPFGAKIEVTGEKAELLKINNIQSREVILGVRPEHMVLQQSKEESSIETKLLVNEMMGSELYLHVEAGEESENVEKEMEQKIVVRVPTLKLEKEQRESLVYGSKIYLTFEGKVMHFFDPETEKNLLYYTEEEKEEAAE